jgi:hypothetical protein
MFSDDEGVEVVGEVRVAFSADDLSTALKRVSSKSGCTVYRMPYTLSIKHHDRQFIFRALVDGKERGTASINYGE